MSDSLQEQKRQRRLQSRSRSQSQPPPERDRQSRLLCQRLMSLPEWTQSAWVFGFYPLPDEPDILPLLRASLESGKQLALPRFNPERGCYEPVAVTDLTGQLVEGKYGVLEPLATCPGVATMHLDFAIIPGVNFDRLCGRLGRGRGYYDRLLSSLNGFKCGVAFTWQLDGDPIPLEPHDVLMNCVVTCETCYPERPGTA